MKSFSYKYKNKAAMSDAQICIHENSNYLFVDPVVKLHIIDIFHQERKTSQIKTLCKSSNCTRHIS